LLSVPTTTTSLEMSEVINLTPHTVSLADADGNVIATFPPSGQVARVATSTEVVAQLMGRPISRTTFGEVTGIPAPAEGVVYLVSTIVAQAARRPDVVSPDTGPTAVRKDGQVVAVRGFQVFA
jgi:hypothetical protein